jgi:hypothetical protein
MAKISQKNREDRAMGLGFLIGFSVAVACVIMLVAFL